LVRCRVLGTLLFICGAGGGFLFECVKTWGGEEVGSGMVERFKLVARPYEVKTQNEGVQGYWSSTQMSAELRRMKRDTE